MKLITPDSAVKYHIKYCQKKDFELNKTKMNAADIRSSEWDEVKVQYDHGTHGTSGTTTVVYVYRRGPGDKEYKPWVVLGPSALLHRVGKHGFGLYAARSFKRGDYIGKYSGDTLGHFSSREDALDSKQAKYRLRRGNDKLITLRVSGSPGVELIDGSTSGPPYISSCNDPRNIGRITANADLTEYGYLRVTHARIPAFNLDKPLDENQQSELRWDYGGDDTYWNYHDQLGCDAEHALVVE